MRDIFKGNQASQSRKKCHTCFELLSHCWYLRLSMHHSYVSRCHKVRPRAHDRTTRCCGRSTHGCGYPCRHPTRWHLNPRRWSRRQDWLRSPRVTSCSHPHHARRDEGQQENDQEDPEPEDEARGRETKLIVQF